MESTAAAELVRSDAPVAADSAATATATGETSPGCRTLPREDDAGDDGGEAKDTPRQPEGGAIGEEKEKGGGQKKKEGKGKKNEKGKAATEESSDLEFTWICVECREAECVTDPESPLIICDGPCNRPFHPPCANLPSLPPADERWVCADCARGRHQCAVCKEYGEDDADVWGCGVRGCGLFFHESCLGASGVDVKIVEEEVEEVMDGPRGGGDDASNPTTTTKIISRPKFRCPAHECWTCSGGPPPSSSAGPAQVCTVVPPSPANDDGDADGPASSKSGKKKKKGRGKKRKTLHGADANVWGTKKERLFRCLDCPISYHITCMPPTCRFHELAMLCHEHAQSNKLPYLDEEYSFQAAVEADAEKKIEAMKRKEERRRRMMVAQSGSDDDEGGTTDNEDENPFLPGLVGSMATFEEEQLAEFLERRDNASAPSGDNDDANGKRRKRRRPEFGYCLPVDFKEEVHSKPPSYTHVNSNRYDPQNRPRRHPPTGERCNCKPPPSCSSKGGGSGATTKACDNRCLNRLAYVECVGKETRKGGDKNPYWNCDCGPECGNRSLSRRDFAKCRPAREHGKGWGLVAVNGVRRGDLVQEYVGEVIDGSTKEERLRAWSRDHPNDPNFYVMALEPGWFIDAREVANMARFINHSCDPNCKLIPFNVAGHIRVAIVCIRDVPPGGHLSYDYKFDTRHGEKFTCRCGASNCRGTMKGTTRQQAELDGRASARKSKRELLAEAKARVQRDKKFLRSVVASERERLHLTGPMVPGADPETAEMVAGGPREKYREEARGLFLWRNAVAGGDFSSRYWRAVKRRKGKEKTKAKENLASLCSRLGPVDVLSYLNDIHDL